MAKNKIEIGQCYEKNDTVLNAYGEVWTAIDNGIWMVIDGPFDNKDSYSLVDRGVISWDIQNTLSKEIYHGIIESELITWRRPFQNFG